MIKRLTEFSGYRQNQIISGQILNLTCILIRTLNRLITEIIHLVIFYSQTRRKHTAENQCAAYGPPKLLDHSKIVFRSSSRRRLLIHIHIRQRISKYILHESIFKIFETLKFIELDEKHPFRLFRQTIAVIESERQKRKCTHGDIEIQGFPFFEALGTCGAAEIVVHVVELAFRSCYIECAHVTSVDVILCIQPTEESVDVFVNPMLARRVIMMLSFENGLYEVYSKDEKYEFFNHVFILIYFLCKKN